MATYNKELFKGLFDNMTSGCAIYKVLNDGEYGKDYIVKDFNNTSLAIEGKTREEVVGKSLADLRPNIDNYGLIDIFRKVWKTGESETFPTKIYVDENYSNYYENYIFRLLTGEIVAMYNDRTELEANREKLDQQRKLFTSLFNNMINGCAIYEVKNNGLNPSDYIISEYSESSSRMGGILREEAIGSSLEQRVGKKEAEELVEVLRRVWKTGESEKYHLKTQNIGEYHFENSVFRLSKNEVAAIYSDVTDEMVYKDKLKESEHKFRLMFDNAPLGYQSADESGTILEINKAWTNIFGYSQNEIIGKNLRELIEKDYIDLYDSVYVDFLKKGKIQIIARAIKKDGALIFIRINGQKIPGVKARPRTLWIIQDITDIFKPERVTKESELRYHGVFDNASIGICNILPNGKFLSNNQKCTEILQYSKEELNKMTYIDIIHQEDVKSSEQMMSELLKGKRDVVKLEKRFIRKDGESINVMFSSSVIRDPVNSPLYTVSLIQDITEQKRLKDENIAMEAQLRNQQKLESIGTLAGGVAHEINNPINGIMNYSQLILDLAESGSDQAEYAQEIIHETERVSDIVKNLLQFSRQEKQDFLKASMNDIVQRTLSLIRTIMKRDQIEITLDIEENMPLILCRDQQLQQVLMNLLTNARDSINEKFKNENDYKIIKIKGKTITVDENKFIRITIEDNGKGISDNIKDNIFDPFFTTKNRDKGTGLGLSISHGIVRDHKGKLYFETEPGKLTKFLMEIPVE